MELYLNDEKLNFTLENEKTIGDVLHSIERELEKEKGTITAVQIDGDSLLAEQIDAAELRLINDIKKLELTCVFEADVTYSLKGLCTEFSHMVPSMTDIPVQFQSGHDNEARKTITKFADDFDFLCHVIALSSLFPETFSKTNIEGKSLTAFIVEFKPILHDLEEALKNNDTVLIGDLSEYEIAPRLQSLSNFGKSLG